MSQTKITIGRASNSDIVVDDRYDTVSNDHAEIVLRNGELFFIDHSSNGSIINNQKVHNDQVGIYQGDQILLAGTFRVDWDIVSRFLPLPHRPTVIKKVRPAYDNPHSRPTDPYNRSASQNASFRGTTPMQSYRSFVPSGGFQNASMHPSFGRQNEYSQADVDAWIGKWNWGAFLSTWLWAVAHKIYWPLFIIPISYIPYLGQVASLILAVYLGFSGSKLAWEKGKYTDFSTFKNVQKKWAIIGIFIFLLGVGVAALSLFYILLLF